MRSTIYEYPIVVCLAEACSIDIERSRSMKLIEVSTMSDLVLCPTEPRIDPLP